MVQWFNEEIIERILRPIFSQMVNTVSSVLEAVFAMIFGVNFLELVDMFTQNVLEALVSIFLGYFTIWFNNIFYGVFVIILFLADIIAAGLNVISGVTPLQVRTPRGGWEERFLTDMLFDGSGVTKVFFGVMLLGLILCVMFTIYAVVKSSFDLGGERPVGKVLSQTGRALLIYLLLPFMMVAGIKLSSLLLVKCDEVLQNGAPNVTMGTYIYASVMQDATRDHVPSPAEAAAEEFMNFLTKGPSALFETRLKIMFAAADMAAGAINSVAEDGELPEYMYFAELQRLVGDSRRTGRPLDDLIMNEFLSGKGSPFANALGFGGMPYLNPYYTGQLVRTERVHSFIGCICAAVMLIFMVISTWISVKKLFEIILLYVISPYFAAFIPLDDGELFGKWRDMFIVRVCLGFGMVLSMNIFLLMVPVIFSRSVLFTVFAPLDMIIRLLLLISLAASVIKAHKTITKTLEAGGSIAGGPADHEADATRLGMALPAIGARTIRTGAGKAVGAATQKGGQTIQNMSNKTVTSLYSGAQSLFTRVSNKSGGRTPGVGSRESERDKGTG